jgi:hypothetical protein
MLNWAREEFRKILPVWIFFFLSFGLLALTRMSILGEYHIKPSEPSEYLIGSLIMAKVVRLVDAFLKTEGWEGRPLIYITLWNTGLYFLAALVLHHVDQLFTARASPPRWVRRSKSSDSPHDGKPCLLGDDDIGTCLDFHLLHTS